MAFAAASTRYGGASFLILAAVFAVAGLVVALLLVIRARRHADRASRRLRRRILDLDLRLAEQIAALDVEIAQRESAEAQVRQMQKVETLGQLTGGIAHDFNNMLAVVIGSLDMARRRIDDPVRFARCLDQADDGARRAAQLTQRLLAFARQQPLDLQVVDINQLVADLADMVRRTLGERVRVEMRLEAALWRVQVDPGQLENAILNLAVNARDAMPEGGVLTIATINVADEFGERVALAITDTGSGMTPEVAARALEPFFTTKEAGHGTGLGLAQVRGFAARAGGGVAITSQPGVGTTITLHLPPYAGTTPCAVAPDALAPADGGGETVLVVEDEPQVRAMSVAALMELGYRVVAAVDGEEALRILDQGSRIDLLFTDVVMPGIDGRALAERARAARPGLRVVYATGYGPGGDGPMLEDGALTLGKPFTMARLAAIVRQALA